MIPGMTELRPIVQLQDLTKSYMEGRTRRLIMDRVSLTFNSGEFILLLGQSGSGKSTLLNLISGIDAPDSGDIFINDIAINRLSDHERTLFRREHIGFVFQFFNLIPTLTVFENVTLAMQLKGGLTAAKVVEAGALLERVGLADEPTGNLDEATGQTILTLLLEMTRQADKTLIMATHNPEIIPLADRVYRVTNGQVMEN